MIGKIILSKCQLLVYLRQEKLVSSNVKHINSSQKLTRPSQKLIGVDFALKSLEHDEITVEDEHQIKIVNSRCYSVQVGQICHLNYVDTLSQAFVSGPSKLNLSKSSADIKAVKGGTFGSLDRSWSYSVARPDESFPGDQPDLGATIMQVAVDSIRVMVTLVVVVTLGYGGAVRNGQSVSFWPYKNTSLNNHFSTALLLEFQFNLTTFSD